MHYYIQTQRRALENKVTDLTNERIDLISVSAHKVYGPKGVGALIARKRHGKRPPLTPLQYGGGQEHGLRPGTLPVHLIVGLGSAAELALRDHKLRAAACLEFRRDLLAAIEPLQPTLYGELSSMIPHVLNVSFDAIDSEALMLVLKDLLAISNGSACTSETHEPSHVLLSMGLVVNKRRVQPAGLGVI